MGPVPGWARTDHGAGRSSVPERALTRDGGLRPWCRGRAPSILDSPCWPPGRARPRGPSRASAATPWALVCGALLRAAHARRRPWPKAGAPEFVKAGRGAGGAGGARGAHFDATRATACDTRRFGLAPPRPSFFDRVALVQRPAFILPEPTSFAIISLAAAAGKLCNVACERRKAHHLCGRMRD